MTLRLAAIVSAITGFVSLSSEILWFRVYSYLTGGSPVTFGLMLGIYLAGLAVGADIAGKICRRNFGTRAGFVLALSAFIATAAAFFVVPAMAYSAGSPGRGGLALAAVLISAAFFGALLPLISHLGVEPDLRAGRNISYIYFANIAGSVTGTLLTGFVLTDVLTTREIALLLALAGLALVFLVTRKLNGRARFAFSVMTLMAAIGFSVTSPRVFDRLYEKLQFKNAYHGQRFAHIVENKHGVVAVTDSGATFGGGVYDGHISTGLVNDPNAIERAYAVSVIHPRPRKVLVIGMATGAWSQVLANHQSVDSVTIIEINPGYLEFVRLYPEVSGLLTNPKIRIVIDDGRRWLTHNPGRRFDLILSNTTFHYRANSTNLLSREFMRLIHAHLNPGGVFFFNTTGSQDAMKTAFTEFPNGLRVANFIAVSDSMIALDSARWNRTLSSYRIEGRPVFDFTDSASVVAFKNLMQLPGSISRTPQPRGLESRESVLRRIPRARVITDDNMLPEWRSLILHSPPAAPDR